MHLTAGHCGGDGRHLDRRVTVMTEQMTGRRADNVGEMRPKQNLDARQYEVGVGQGNTPTQ